MRTLCFVKARKVAEMLLQNTRSKLEGSGHRAQAARVSSYRGGYLPLERREIEAKLFSGETLGCIATSALELGVDVGTLDCTVHVGYPGSIASTWQQAGRAGRGGRRSLSILVASSGPVDQHWVKQPAGQY